MTTEQLLAVLDKLESRRRREYDQARTWLLQTSADLSGPPSPLNGEDVDNQRMPLLLKLPDAADALGVSLTTLKRIIRAGDLPTVKVCSDQRIRRDDLLAYYSALGDPAEQAG